MLNRFKKMRLTGHSPTLTISDDNPTTLSKTERVLKNEMWMDVVEEIKSDSRYHWNIWDVDRVTWKEQTCGDSTAIWLIRIAWRREWLKRCEYLAVWLVGKRRTVENATINWTCGSWGWPFELSVVARTEEVNQSQFKRKELLDILEPMANLLWLKWRERWAGGPHEYRREEGGPSERPLIYYQMRLEIKKKMVWARWRTSCRIGVHWRLGDHVDNRESG